MQLPNTDCIYYDEFLELQKKLPSKIRELHKSWGMVQEDMANYELSVRQYQRMEEDPTAIVSLWQIFKLAKAHDLDVHELLDL